MSDLYIQIKDGVTVNHPAAKENLLEAFGEIPTDWEPFLRISKPIVRPPQIIDSTSPLYEKIHGVWMDVWVSRPMTANEIQALKEQAQRAWDNHPDAYNFKAWVFNEATCEFEAPIPQPIDGKYYKWSGVDNAWREAPLYPDAGGEYIFDFRQWVWVSIALI